LRRTSSIATVRLQKTESVNRCNHRWLRAEEVYCELDAGHAGEHSSRAVMEFAGHTGRCEIWWQSPKIPLEKPAKTGV